MAQNTLRFSSHGAASSTCLLSGDLRPARVVDGSGWQAVPIEERMALLDVPATSLAIVDEMALAGAQAWGVLVNGEGVLASAASLFQAASISKPVAAVGALALVRQGRLALQGDVAGRLGGWHLPRGEHTGDVTLERLLSHSAGVGTPGFEGYGVGDVLPTLCQMLNGEPPANSPAVRLVDAPGSGFAYSGGGYLVIQALMEAALDLPFARIMREQVFDPLEMNDSHYAPLCPAFVARAASGHEDGGRPIPGKGPIHVESAAGGLWTTPTDLARLLIEIMRAYRGDDGAVLSAGLAREMLTPRFWDFGLGVRIQGSDGTLRFSHGGATRGWQGFAIAYPERGQGIIVLTNGANGYLLWPEMVRAVACQLGWPDWEPQVLCPMGMDGPTLAAYAGSYRGDDFAIQIGVDPPGIRVVLDQVTWRAVPTAGDHFELLDLEGQVAFGRSNSGRVESVDLWFGLPDWSPYRGWHFARDDSATTH